MGIFKKGLLKDLAKYFPNFTQHAENLLVCQFNIRDLTNEYVMVLLVKDETKMKINLASNHYTHF